MKLKCKSANEAKDALKAAIEKNDIEEIRTKKDALQEIVQNLTLSFMKKLLSKLRRNKVHLAKMVLKTTIS